MHTQKCLVFLLKRAAQPAESSLQRASPDSDSSATPGEGSDPSSRSPVAFIVGVYHSSVAGCPSPEQPLRARVLSWSQAVSGCEHPAGNHAKQPCCLGAALQGLLVLVTKLFPKMSVKNRKRLPPVCLHLWDLTYFLLFVHKAQQHPLYFWLAEPLQERSVPGSLRQLQQ